MVNEWINRRELGLGTHTKVLSETCRGFVLVWTQLPAESAGVERKIMIPPRRNEKTQLSEKIFFFWVSNSATSLSRYFTAVKLRILRAFTCSQTMLRVNQENNLLGFVTIQHWLEQFFLLLWTLYSLILKHTRSKYFTHYGQTQQYWAFYPSSPQRFPNRSLTSRARFQPVQ